MSRVVVCCRIREEAVARIDAMAADLGITRGECVERLLIAGLEKGEKDLSFLNDPVMRTIVDWIYSSPQMVKLIGRMNGVPLDDEGAKAASKKLRRVTKQKGKAHGTA